MIVYNAAGPAAVLNDMLLGMNGGDLTMKINMFTNDIVPDPGASTTQFTNAAYTGFAGDVTFAWSGPALDENGQYHLLKASIPASNGETIDVGPLFGYWVNFDTDHSPKLWIAELFTQPITLTPGGLLYLSPELVLPALAGSARVDQ